MKAVGLETTLKDKVSSLLEESMEKNWGLSIPKLELELSDKLQNPYFNLYIPLNSNFHDAKKQFKAGFLKQELQLHQGNISRLAHFLGLDRRSIHRVIKELAIEMPKVRVEEQKKEYQQEVIDHTIRETLDKYKEIIQPQKLEKMYQEVPRLSKNIAQFVTHQTLPWKEAEQEFERQFLLHALKETNSNVKAAAVKIGLRTETLHRKIKKLGLR